MIAFSGDVKIPITAFKIVRKDGR